MSLPTAVTVASFALKPPLLMTRRNCDSVTVLRGVSRTSVIARSSETSTDSTPGSLRMATRTAWAHTAQSIPSVFISTLRNSADAAIGSMSTTNNADMTHAIEFIVCPLYGSQKKQLTFSAKRKRSRACAPFVR